MLYSWVKALYSRHACDVTHWALQCMISPVKLPVVTVETSSALVTVCVRSLSVSFIFAYLKPMINVVFNRVSGLICVLH